MNKKWGFLILVLIALPIMVLAQVATNTLSPVITDPSVADGEFFKLLLGSLNGFKGASALAIAALATQIVTALLKTPMFNNFFGNMMGKYKLMIVTGVSMAAGVLSLKVAGLDWMAVITHSFTLTAMQVFGHQIVSQVTEKSDAPAAPSA